MTKCTFLNLTLMLMLMTASIRSASLPSPPSTQDLLSQVIEEAENANKHQLDEKVMKVYNQTDPCKKGFFCLAEKVLKKAVSPKISTLLRKLEVYNAKENGVRHVCPRFNTTRTIKLSKLVKEIHTCAVIERSETSNS